MQCSKILRCFFFIFSENILKTFFCGKVYIYSLTKFQRAGKKTLEKNTLLLSIFAQKCSKINFSREIRTPQRLDP